MTLLTFGETPLRFVPAGDERLRRAREATIRADGTESNVAAAAAAMGTESTWLSKLPDTPLGRRVVSELHGHGVDTEVAWAEDGRQGLQFHEGGARPRDGTTIQDRSNAAMSSVSPSELPMGDVRNAEAMFTGASTLALSEDAADTAEALFGAAQGTDVVTATDVDLQPGLCSAADAREALERLADSLDVLVANEEQARDVLDVSGQARELVTTVGAEYDLEMVVITRSERGAVVLHDTPGTNVVHEREAVEAETVDAAGQHAAFVGVFLQRLVEGADAAEALSYAVAAGALAGTVPGPFLTVDRSEVDRVVEEAVQ